MNRLDPYGRWLKLYQARNEPEANQRVLGPREHGAFAESVVSENPLMAVPLLFATPAYSVAKELGLLKTRSPASLDEVAEGYRGIGRGLMRWF